MWKIFAFTAIFGTLAVGVFAAQSTPLGTPEQGISKSNRGQRGKDKDASAREEERPTQTVVNVVQAAPPISEGHAEESAENLKIQGYLAMFTGLLVAVGFLQVITMALQTGLFWGTLKAGQRQGDIMERQAKATDATVEALKRQISDSHEKERARIVVKIVPDKQPITHPLWGVRFQVRNIGPTRAFDIWLNVGFEFIPSFTPPRIPQTKMLAHIPRIQPEKWRHVDCGAPYWGGGGRESNQARMLEVADGKLCMHLRGTVEYKDIFGDSHVIPFRYMWHPAVEPPQWAEAVNSEDPKAT